jgi:hypothetical protein
MEAKFSSGSLDDFQRTTRRYIPENRTLYNHVCEKPKSCIVKIPVHNASLSDSLYFIQLNLDLLRARGMNWRYPCIH